MTTIVGADGCPAGWICIFEELPTRRLGSKIFETVGELFDAAPEVEVLAIDIPIGLMEEGPRECDLAARKRLGAKRGTSVFPTPRRAVVHRGETTGVSKQTLAICPKIRQVDHLLRRHPQLRERVYESHPEVSFCEWSGAPIVEPKRTPGGFAIRHALVSAHFGGQAYQSVRARYSRNHVADDDILDAFATLWTAERIARGEAQSLPDEPALDTHGLLMRIVY